MNINFEQKINLCEIYPLLFCVEEQYFDKLKEVILSFVEQYKKETIEVVFANSKEDLKKCALIYFFKIDDTTCFIKFENMRICNAILNWLIDNNFNIKKCSGLTRSSLLHKLDNFF